MITKLTVKNFRQLTSRELFFAEGINVVRGNNEAGKSTITAAILAGLYVDVATRAKSFFDGALNWKTKSKDIYLELNFVKPHGSYQLVKDFASQQQFLKNLSDNKQLGDSNAILATLQNEIGIPNQEVFTATSFIRQSEISNLQLSNDIQSALQRISSISPEGVNLQKNIKELETELSELQLGINRPSKNPGAIKSTQLDLEESQQQLAELKQKLEESTSAKNAGSEAAERSKVVQEKISEIEKLLDNHSKLESGTKELEKIETDLKEINEQLSKVSQTQVQLKQVAAVMDKFAKFNNPQAAADAEELVNTRQTLQALNDQSRELLSALQNLENAKVSNYSQHSDSLTQGNIMGNFGFLGLAIGALLGFAGLVSNVSTLLIIAATVLIISGVLFGYLILRKLGKPNYKSTLPNERKQEYQVLNDQISSLNRKIEAHNQHLAGLLNKYGYQDYQDFFTDKAKMQATKAEYERLESNLKGLLQDKDFSTLQEKYNQLSLSKRDLEASVLTPEVKASQLSPNDYLKQRRELDMLQIEQKKLERDIASQETRSTIQSVNVEEVTNLEEKVDMLQGRLQSLELRATVLAKTVEVLKAAISTTSQDLNSVVVGYVEGYLSKITKERYKDFRLNKDFDIEVFASELNDWVKPLGQLSLGTVDQIYFLVRIALAKALLGGNLPYLFLDDPFVTFDQERLLQVKEILEGLAKEKTQVFLFTHNTFYNDWGNLIEI